MIQNNSIIENIKSLREKALKKKKEINLNKPVSFWIKEDRLLNEIGKEFTIILRTRGCSWALGDYGGCSMCGYIQDAYREDVSSNQILKQFDYALQAKLNEIKNNNVNYIIKIYNSGSFLDDSEICSDARKQIYAKIAKLEKIKEVVIESRVEYIKSENLIEIQENLKNKYTEIGIGLETVDDHVRNNYINKGLLFKDFENAVRLCKDYNIGVKVYLLFKPPFLNEQSAIDDCVNSIQKLLNLNVNTISINPLNIQKGSLVENLWYQKRYRPPWFYSLFKCIKHALTKNDLNKIRILSDPSGAGTKRGIHNCSNRECNQNMIKTLKNFVLSQNLSELNKSKYECVCKKKYQIEKDFK
ncbi:MAG: archaeosine biosynthesis radical SAM protein RaSEA [Promethearchaeota archaeon]